MLTPLLLLYLAVSSAHDNGPGHSTQACAVADLRFRVIITGDPDLAAVRVSYVNPLGYPTPVNDYCRNPAPDFFVQHCVDGECETVAHQTSLDGFDLAFLAIDPGNYAVRGVYTGVEHRKRIIRRMSFIR